MKSANRMIMEFRHVSTNGVHVTPEFLEYLEELWEKVVKINNETIYHDDQGRVRSDLNIVVTYRNGSSFSIEDFDDLVSVLRREPYLPKSLEVRMGRMHGTYLNIALGYGDIYITRIIISSRDRLTELREEVIKLLDRAKPDASFLHNPVKQGFLSFSVMGGATAMAISWVGRFLFGQDSSLIIDANFILAWLFIFPFVSIGSLFLLRRSFPPIEFTGFQSRRINWYRRILGWLISFLALSIFIPIIVNKISDAI